MEPLSQLRRGLPRPHGGSESSKERTARRPHLTNRLLSRLAKPGEPKGSGARCSNEIASRPPNFANGRVLPLAIVTGSGGLVGSESVSHLVEAGFDVIGIENDMRASFFGPEASTAPQTERLLAAYPHNFESHEIEIRDQDAVEHLFHKHRRGPRARCPHSRAALSRLGGNRSTNRLHGQCQRHAQSARSNPQDPAPRDVHLHLDEQGLRRSAQRPSPNRASGEGGASGGSRVLRRAFPRPCRSTALFTPSSESRRPPRISWCRSTDGTSACLPRASAGAASPARIMPGRASTAFFRT